MNARQDDSTAYDALNQRYLMDFPAEAAQVIETLPIEQALQVLKRQPVNVILPIWQYLSSDIAGAIFNSLTTAKKTKLLNELEPALCANMLLKMPREEIDDALEHVNKSVADELKTLLEYPPDSAGKLMDPRILLFRPSMNVEQVQTKLRSLKPKLLREVFVIDEKGSPIGRVALQDIAIADADTTLEEIILPVLTTVQDIAPREEIVEKLERYKASSIPVVDFEGRLIGIIREERLLAALQEEMSLDIQTMVGASKDERSLSPVSFAVAKRLPWLHINLVTAFLASAVVGLFESTIAQFTALAVLLPVVAGQSGNAGAQALAVTMRGLALREISIRHWPRVVVKEVNTGLVNGVAIALTTAVCVYFWSTSFGLAMIIAMAMIISMIAAGFSGAFIPITLKRLGQDPAQSSSIILTTVTDVVGFFSFLGIATLLSTMLK
ncbi:MAG: magnesium transporter [Gammaproteobacteria bacterium]|jgi:magnesium transporter